jgi:hypothetical protein
MMMLQELSDLKGLTTAQVIGGVTVIIVIALIWAEVFGDFVTGIIAALRQPQVIVSHNICPRCQRIQTQEIDPS